MSFEERKTSPQTIFVEDDGDTDCLKTWPTLRIHRNYLVPSVIFGIQLLPRRVIDPLVIGCHSGNEAMGPSAGGGERVIRSRSNA
jgi:hypothetical protein